MIYLKYLFSILLGFSSGTVTASGVFAFITAIGIVQRFAQKTRTARYVKLYEEAIIVGGIFGSLTLWLNMRILLPSFIVAALSLSIGIYMGVLAISLAETINVFPILSRRINLTTGFKYFILSYALGKVVGALMYFIVDGFFDV